MLLHKLGFLVCELCLEDFCLIYWHNLLPLPVQLMWCSWKYTPPGVPRTYRGGHTHNVQSSEVEETSYFGLAPRQCVETRKVRDYLAALDRQERNWTTKGNIPFPHISLLFSGRVHVQKLSLSLMEHLKKKKKTQQIQKTALREIPWYKSWDVSVQNKK